MTMDLHPSVHNLLKTVHTLIKTVHDLLKTEKMSAVMIVREPSTKKRLILGVTAHHGSEEKYCYGQ